MKHTFFLLISFCIFSACSSDSGASVKGKSDKGSSTNNEQSNSHEVESIDGELNNIACFLGGTQPKQVGEYSLAFNSVNWRNHQKAMQNAWTKATLEKISPMREWSKSEKIEKKSETLFYPFSGADFLHVYSAHPNYSSYYLFGLEPVGEIPSKANILDVSKTENILSTIYKSVDENLSQSFFHTKYMAVEFGNPILKGTIPVFMFFMNRMGVEITSIQAVKYDDKGMIVKEKEFNSGVRIGFIDSGKQKELFYFSGDISNKGMTNSTGLKAMISRISKDATTMMKSASYLCHMPDFSIIRDLIIANAHTIMQDDAGVPFKYYDKSKWNFRHFGVYTQPIPLFASRGQIDLRNAVQGIEKPITFRYGYNSPPNIMIATRK